MADNVECYLKLYGQCCCTCLNHLTDVTHPITGEKSHGEFKGWICFPPEFEGKAFSGWSEHGMCEMWSKRK
jgi:hypothetical protein